MDNDYFDDDENVKDMRDTARTIGLTELVMELRREQVTLLSSMDGMRARLTQALALLGVSDTGKESA